MKTKKRTKALNSTKKSNNYEKCSICKNIPEKSYAFWKGGELGTDPLPASEKFLEIVGAPFYDDSRSYSNSCIKRCPECGTCYFWDFTYEYLVNGSEDEITLTRLSQSEAEKIIENYFKHIEATKEKFKEWAIPHLEELHRYGNKKDLSRASTFFSYHQLKGLDISLGIQELVDALAKHPHTEGEYCVGNSIYLVLSEYAKKSKKTRMRLFELLERINQKTSAPELGELMIWLKKKYKDL